MRQIVMNGLTNAIKYSNAAVNGAIRVVACIRSANNTDINDSRGSGSRDGGAAAGSRGGAGSRVTLPPAQQWLVIQVLDRGPGLRGMNEKTMFTDFSAAPTVTTTAPQDYGKTQVGSSGVGLPICARCGYCCCSSSSSCCCCCLLPLCVGPLRHGGGVAMCARRLQARVAARRAVARI